jgi:CubicO group peptidase (beta-lactamase class C family)
MKKRAIKILYWFLGILIFINLGIIITGNTYLYKTLYYQSAKIDNYKIFENRKVATGKTIIIPESKNYNKIKLDTEWRKILETHKTVAYLVLVDDSITYEEYWDGYSDSSYSGSFSVAKSIISLLIGIAVDEHKIKSVDEKVSDFIPEYKNGLNAKLTIKHLLTMSSGFDWNESYGNPFSITAKAYYGSDLTAIINNLKVIEEPGVRFNYQSANTFVLGYILRQATGMTISQYASEKLWKPLGATKDALWSLDKNDGLEKAYCCFNSNARDFSRIGLLALHNGKYDGKQIVSEEYIKASVSAANFKNASGLREYHYGYSWWRAKIFGNDFFYARGILGQFIIVIPQKNMVIVRLGKENIQIGDRIPAEIIAEFTYNNFIK